MLNKIINNLNVKNVFVLKTNSNIDNKIVQILKKNNIGFAFIDNHCNFENYLVIIPLNLKTITPAVEFLNHLSSLNSIPYIIFAVDFEINQSLIKRLDIEGIVGIIDILKDTFIPIITEKNSKGNNNSLNALIYTIENLISHNIYKSLSDNPFYKTMSKLHPFVICVTTLEGTIIFFKINSKYLSRFINLKKALYGKKIFAFTDSTIKLKKLFKKIDTNQDQCEEECSFKFQNETFNLLVSGEKLKIYEDFEVYLLIGINITNEVKTKDLLFSSEIRYRALVENLPDGVCLLRNLDLVYVNSKFLEIFKLPDDLFLTDIDILSLIHNEDINEFLSIINNDFVGTQKLNIKGKTTNNQTIYLEVQISPFEIYNERYLQIYWHDITQTKELRDKLIQSERLSAIGELASGITHEFNNILTSIKGYIKYILQHPDNLNTNIQALQSIDNMINQGSKILKNLSMLAKNNITIKEQCNLLSIIEDILTILEKVLLKDNITIKKEIECNPVVFVDSGLIKQVILNIIINSVHAIKLKGEGHIIIKIEEDKNYAIVSIIDNGIGIPDNIKGEIFNPFFTTKHGGIKNISGTGLGLSISKNIIEAHNGKILFNSKEGEGTTFQIFLPKNNSIIIESGFNNSKNLNALSILVCDDEQPIRFLLSTLLTSIGIKQIQEASNGQQAYELALKNNFDYILMDISMPILNGIDATKKIKSKKPNQKIILLTGFNDKDEIKKMIKNNLINAYIKKPFDINQIKNLFYN